MSRHVQRFTYRVAAAALGVLLGATAARAQGYGLYEMGSCMTGRAGAGVASPCDDGSAIFFNPAGLALDLRPVLSGGATGIGPRGNFTDSATGLVSTLNTKWYPVPAVYGAVPLGTSVIVGAGLFAPYGLTTDWPPTFEGRYLGYYSKVQSIYVQPTIAFRATDHVMIGAGIDITHTSADLRQRVDLSSLPITGTPFTFARIGVPAGTDFADVKIDGSGNHVGAHVGIIVEANENFSIGARYLTNQTVDVRNGTFSATQIPTGLRTPIPLGATIPAGTPIDAIVAGTFASGGPLSTQTASTSMPLPSQFVAGIAVSATPQLKILADYQYTHWKSFDVLTVTKQYGAAIVTPEGYNDTHGVRLGAEYTGPAILRFGIDVHGAAAPDETVTPRLPEASRWEIGAGIGIPASPHFRFDFGYLYVHQNDRRGRTGELPNNGTYHYYANLFSGAFVVHF